MSNEKLIKVMKNFDEEYLFALLGDLKDALIEWKDSKNILTYINPSLGASRFAETRKTVLASLRSTFPSAL